MLMAERPSHRGAAVGDVAHGRAGGATTSFRFDPNSEHSNVGGGGFRPPPAVSSTGHHDANIDLNAASLVTLHPVAVLECRRRPPPPVKGMASAVSTSPGESLFSVSTSSTCDGAVSTVIAITAARPEEDERNILAGHHQPSHVTHPLFPSSSNATRSPPVTPALCRSADHESAASMASSQHPSAMMNLQDAADHAVCDIVTLGSESNSTTSVTHGNTSDPGGPAMVTSSSTRSSGVLTSPAPSEVTTQQHAVSVIATAGREPGERPLAPAFVPSTAVPARGPALSPTRQAPRIPSHEAPVVVASSASPSSVTVPSVVRAPLSARPTRSPPPLQPAADSGGVNRIASSVNPQLSGSFHVGSDQGRRRRGSDTSSIASCSTVCSGNVLPAGFKYAAFSTDIRCYACRGPVRHPVVCRPCQHPVCRACVPKTGSGNVFEEGEWTCPRCHAVVQEHVEPDATIRDAVASITLVCDDCDWSGARGLAVRHQCAKKKARAAVSIISRDAGDPQGWLMLGLAMEKTDRLRAKAANGSVLDVTRTEAFVKYLTLMNNKFKALRRDAAARRQNQRSSSAQRQQPFPPSIEDEEDRHFMHRSKDDLATAWGNLGTSLQATTAATARTAAGAPPLPATVTVGNVTYDRVACLIQSLEMNPKQKIVWFNLGNALKEGEGRTISTTIAEGTEVANAGISGTAAATPGHEGRAGGNNPPAAASRPLSTGGGATMIDSTTAIPPPPVPGGPPPPHAQETITLTKSFCYIRSVLLDVYFPEGWFNLGISLLNDGDATVKYRRKVYDAPMCFIMALLARPEYPEAWFQLGIAGCDGKTFFDRQWTQKDCLRKALSLKPTMLEAWRALSKIMAVDELIELNDGSVLDLDAVLARTAVAKNVSPARPRRNSSFTTLPSVGQAASVPPAAAAPARSIRGNTSPRVANESIPPPPGTRRSSVPSISRPAVQPAGGIESDIVVIGRTSNGIPPDGGLVVPQPTTTAHRREGGSKSSDADGGKCLVS